MTIIKFEANLSDQNNKPTNFKTELLKLKTPF